MGNRDQHGLAGYAMRVRKTLGRRYPEAAHPYRNEYERDRDRIIHSRAFRRLQNKTQVFTRRFSDHFRDRLTHTLEVAQISRTVAKALRLNLDLAEALALVHDVGHPPFGHAGEEELNRLMKRYGEQFDHNLHALRIVERFEQKYVSFSGLNLTFEVREGIIKHSRDYDPEQYSELGEYRLAERPPLEAQLIDVADEIAYNCADLDDGFESKLLALNQIRESVPFFDRFFRPVERKYPNAQEKLKFNEALKRLMDVLVTDVIVATGKRLEKQGVQTITDVRLAPRRLVALGPGLLQENRKLKTFLHQNLYSHRDVYSERKRIVTCVKELFEFFMDRPRALPHSYVTKLGEEPTHRIVCDYIAGMTDNYLAEQHHKYVGQ